MKRKPPEIHCARCGTCCLADMIAYVTQEDLDRWKSQGRQDILHIIETRNAAWMGDHFVSADSGRYLHACPFLRIQGQTCACSIYETRPAVCRDYVPGSSEICPLWQATRKQG
ncbi:MAG TPA: YkgJ family cysteine cluster protein [Deltaproteobacteria bacterium]|nr:YkgJ family cysteine cluster protein [Deltaproteobacteria bacterium]